WSWRFDCSRFESDRDELVGRRGWPAFGGTDASSTPPRACCAIPAAVDRHFGGLATRAGSMRGALTRWWHGCGSWWHWRRASRAQLLHEWAATVPSVGNVPDQRSLLGPISYLAPLVGPG